MQKEHTTLCGRIDDGRKSARTVDMSQARDAESYVGHERLSAKLEVDPGAINIRCSSDRG